MRDNELQFDRSCHVLYPKPAKADSGENHPALSGNGREAVWERVQLRYAELLADWRTDLGGRKNFHNGTGGISTASPSCAFTMCAGMWPFREVEEIEENSDSAGLPEAALC